MSEAHLPPVTGADVARALQRAGLDVRLESPDYAQIHRDGVPVVRVPLLNTLRPALVVAIVRTVGLTPQRFMSLLGE